MKCAACSQPINRSGGYYLVGNSPYCSNCFQGVDRHRGKNYPVQSFATGWEQDNLLEAFRAYQERERQSAVLRY